MTIQKTNIPLMPKATAIWLIDNTTLTFQQIAEFCDLHILEIQSIADQEIAKNVIGIDPISSNQISQKEIERCQDDPSAKLTLSEHAQQYIKNYEKKKGTYTPIARRQDKPNGVAWLLKNCPEMTDTQICKLIGTTKNTIESIRDRSHRNYSSITQKDPVLLGLCMQHELDKISTLAIESIKTSELKKKQEKQKEIEVLIASSSA